MRRCVRLAGGMQVEAARELAAEKNVDLRTAELHVSSQESADRAVQQVLGAAGRLDIIIHNAGHMVFGPAEAFTPEQLAEIYGANVLSTQRVNRAALPAPSQTKEAVWSSGSGVATQVLAHLPPLRRSSRQPFD